MKRWMGWLYTVPGTGRSTLRALLDPVTLGIKIIMMMLLMRTMTTVIMIMKMMIMMALVATMMMMMTVMIIPGKRKA